jgi:hypothetical protein
MEEAEIRRLIEEHFAAASHDQVKTQEIYTEDAVLEFPQGGERIRGKVNIKAMRSAYPARLEFEIRRTIGSGDLWVNEYVIRYEGKPVNVVGIMEFRDGKVVRETIYFGEPWDPPKWRSEWVEPLTD